MPFQREYLCEMKRRRIFYIVFFSLLVVGFFITLSYVIPGYVNPKLSPIGTVKPFAFKDQDGKHFTEKDMAGKIVAVNYFFTTCTGICPKMTNNLLPVYKKFRNEEDFMLVSHTCDPERDSVPELKTYAEKYSIDTEKWTFLTGAKDSLYNMARHSYMIDDPKNYVKGQEDIFLHTQFIALVNRQGEVVGIYDGIKSSEMTLMSEKITELLKQ